MAAHLIPYPIMLKRYYEFEEIMTCLPCCQTAVLAGITAIATGRRLFLWCMNAMRAKSCFQPALPVGICYLEGVLHCMCYCCERCEGQGSWCKQADTDLAMVMVESSSTASQAASRLDAIRISAEASKKVRLFTSMYCVLHYCCT